MTNRRVLLLAICFLFKIASAQDFNSNCKTPEQKDGFCISARECETLLINANSSEFSNKSEDVLRQDICETAEGETPKVCCPNDRSTATEESQSNESVNVEYPLNETCGFESGSRSRNEEASIEDYRWLVLLKYEKEGDPYICGGSLISKNYIVTAAHCIQNKYKLISVRLGDYDIRTDTDCIRFHVRRNKGSVLDCKPPHQDFNISSEDTVVHPDYTPTSSKNDIGLIRLKETLNISKESIFPICLPSTLDEGPSEPTVYTVAGWGASSSGLSSPVLLQGYTRRVEGRICDDAIGGNLTVNDVCGNTRYAGRRCITDDGGPLISYRGKESRFVLSGIATRMPSTCDTDEIIVGYTKINSYINWILDKISS